jgi:hypothetical protein
MDAVFDVGCDRREDRAFWRDDKLISPFFDVAHFFLMVF